MFNFFKKNTIKPTVLIILDGFGVAPPSAGNAISLAKTPNYNRILATYPHGDLIASGESVGLPANEVGNTEVGHLTLGAGRTILQDLKRINQSIEKGTFYDNKALVAAASHAKANNSALHIMGLASSGNVHSNLNHLFALIQFCKKEELKKVYLHLFTDGRDAPPKEGIEIISKVESQLLLSKIGQIASITGRYYAMDRDKRWDRTAKTYKALVLGQAIQTGSAGDAINSAYARGATDEFVEPTLIADQNGPIGLIKDNDAILFFNFRIDRPKQLTQAFVVPDFEKSEKIGTSFNRDKILTNINFTTMTDYEEGLPVSGVAFGPETVELPISHVISSSGLKQVHLAESEKERFVSYYFDGIREEKAEGETLAIVASPHVSTYDKIPQMSLPQLVSECKKQLARDEYHFAVVNIANADMVAHSGNLDATVKAITYIDRYLNDLVEYILKLDGTAIITSDHGNAEELVSFPSSSFYFTTNKGTVNTDHSNNPVPVIIINNKFKGNPINLGKGSLPDVAPTILGLMGLKVPEVMTGRDLLAVVK